MSRQTVCDVWHESKRPKNVTVAKSMDVAWFWSRMHAALMCANAQSPINEGEPPLPPQASPPAAQAQAFKPAPQQPRAFAPAAPGHAASEAVAPQIAKLSKSSLAQLHLLSGVAEKMKQAKKDDAGVSRKRKKSVGESAGDAKASAPAVPEGFRPGRRRSSVKSNKSNSSKKAKAVPAADFDLEDNNDDDDDDDDDGWDEESLVMGLSRRGSTMSRRSSTMSRRDSSASTTRRSSLRNEGSGRRGSLRGASN